MRTIRIGRSQTNDCIFANNTVSGIHAVLVVDESGERGTLKDLNSTNGTFVNNKRIIVESSVSIKDTIRFGSENTSLKEIIDKSGKTIIKPVLKGVDRKTIGKSPDCDIRYAQSDVSRNHAVMYKTETGAIVIEDQGSTNGTYVNGIKITSKELRTGDRVTIARNYPLDWESIYITPPPPKPIWQKVAIIFIVGVLLIGGGVWGYIKFKESKEWPPEKIFATYKKSVVLIYNQYTFKVSVGEYNLSDIVSALPDNYYIDGNGKLQVGVAGATGTGFYVSSDGKIATNRHVVSLMGNEDAIANYIKTALSQILFQTYGNQARDVVDAMNVRYVQSISIAMNDAYLSSEKDLLSCTLLKVSDNPDLDVAVIQLNTKETPASVTHLVDMNNLTDEDHLSMGNNLYTLGFPKGLEWSLTQHGVQSTDESGSVNQDVSEYLYGHNINVTHGASGSPIFDTKGRFAGIIVSGTEYQSISPSGDIIQIPAQHNQAVKPQPAANFIKNIN